MTVGDFAQLGIDERNQMIQRGLIAAGEGLEQQRNRTVFLHGFQRHPFSPVAADEEKSPEQRTHYQ
jgi:hypothetical protein